MIYLGDIDVRKVTTARLLHSSVALGALALASTAHAACNTVNGVVTCTGANTSDQVNTAIRQNPPPSVSVVIASGASVVGGFASQIDVNSFQFNRAVGYTNDGVVGTTIRPIDFRASGEITNSNNTFTLVNRGTQNGRIIASAFGGAITATNSGTITGGIDLSGVGPITFTNTGTIFRNSPFNPAINLSSSRTISTVLADGALRSTVIGGTVTAAIGGTVIAPASGGNSARRELISIRGVSGADVTMTGQAGALNVTAGGSISDQLFIFTQGRLVQVSSLQSTGGDARVTLGQLGGLTSISIGSGSGTATAIINGTVSRTMLFDGSGSVNVFASGSEGGSRQVNTFENATTPSSQSSSSSNRNTAGAVLIDIGSTGRVASSVTASSTAGSAIVRVAGNVGELASGGSVMARSNGLNTTFESNSLSRPDGSSQSSGSSSQGLSGGAASTQVATTGNVIGNVQAFGDASGTVENAGRIDGSVVAGSGSAVTTSSSSTSSRTVTNGLAGARTFVDLSNSSQVNETLGGTGRVINATTGTIGGVVQIAGFAGTTLDNAGTIRGSVFLGSSGNRSTSTSSNRTVQTVVPVGSALFNSVTTFLTQDTTSNSSSRPTGGAVTGIYGGTIGVAQPVNFNGFTEIRQFGTTSSAATVSGTVYADFLGNAGGQTIDTANTSIIRQVTQLNGASTREQASTFGQTVGQTASTSTMTIAATGVMASNGNAGGSVSLVSAGGNATFALEGGRVEGSVNVNAGTGLNTVQTSNTMSTFTRAPAQLNVFVLDVQQSQVTNSTSDERAVRGTATAMVTGTVGRNLRLSGTGIGAGTLAASVVVDGTVTGVVSANALARDFQSTGNDTATRTGPTTVVRTVTNSTFSAPSADSGNVLIAINGIAGGGIEAAAGGGSATVNLNGRAGTVTPGGVSIRAFDFTEQRDSRQTSSSTSFFSSFPLTASRLTIASNAVGGAAALNVTPSAALLANRASSIEGNVLVTGRTGSTLNVATGSLMLQTVGNVTVGSNLNDTTSDTTGVFSGTVQTGSTGTSTARAVSGLATITNAGTIGSGRNLALVTAAGVGGATVRNTGTITGSIVADARGSNRASTTTTTDQNNFLLRRTVTTNVFTAVGGAAIVDNSALINGDVVAMGATGTVTNTGVIRGAVQLGGRFTNLTTTVTTTTNPVTGMLVTTTTETPAASLFNQSYRFDQNGLLLSGVNVTTNPSVDASGRLTRTSNISAAINLNNGSITLGNITADLDSNTSVTLNGTGFLGVAANDLPSTLVPGQIVTGFQPTPTLARFTAIDPTLGTTTPLPSGSRVLRVQTLTKAGDGSFVIVGAPFLPAVGAASPTFTLDVATLRVSGGELQLGLAGTTPTLNSFGIRGNVENNASFVIGRRLTDGTQTAIRGINVGVGGNLTNAVTGSLVVGVNPAFIRTGSGIVPFAGAPAALASTNSFVSVDGNLALSGILAVQTASNGVFEAGRAYDLFSVGGTYSNTGTVQTNLVSPFISFTLTPRSEGGRTLVSLNVARANFDSVTTDRNAAAAARALQAAIPGVNAGLRTGSAGVQDLAAIIATFDTQFTAAQSAEAFRQLSSGEFYGSLGAISTTFPFGEATDGLAPSGSASGVGLWFRPTGQFATYKANVDAGASAIELDNYGGSLGLNYTTSGGTNFGVAGGYSKLKVRAVLTPENARAETFMVGVYASHDFDALHISGQAVYGWSDWVASRGLSAFGRTATSRFKSNELRASLRIAYDFAIATRIALTPFARAEVRHVEFDGFDEQGAGSIGLAVARRLKTVFSPELGLRLSGATDNDGRIRPFAEASYIFQGDVATDRQVAFLGDRTTSFSLEGVRPRDHIKAAVGVTADIGLITLFGRADYASGGQQQVGSVRGGVLVRF